MNEGLKLHITNFSWEWRMDEDGLGPTHHPSKSAYVSIGFGRSWCLKNNDYFYINDKPSRR